MLYRQTRGHPLFTVELLRGLQEQGDLVRDSEGRWIAGPALDWQTLPARVEAVIAERIGRLPEPLRAALRAASVEGEVFTAEVVARLQANSEDEMVRHLSRDLDRRHRLVRAQGILRLDGQRLSQYRFRHILFQTYLYHSLDEVERAHLHEAVGNTLEALHEGQPEAMAAIAGQLAWHFQEAGIADKAVHYLHQAGERAVQLSAHEEAIAHLTRGLELLATLPDPGRQDQRLARARRELALQLTLGVAWMPTDAGVGGMTRAYTRARELSLQTGQASELCRIQGQLATTHYVRAEYHRARELADEALSLAQQAEDPLLVALGHWRLGFVLFALGACTPTRAHLKHMLAFYEPRHHDSFIFLSGSDPGVSALAYDACCLWCLGYPDQATTRSKEALTLARALGHAFALAEALWCAGCLFNAMRREPLALRGSSEELLRLVNEKAMPTWLGVAICHQGQALAMLGQVQEGMAQILEGMAERASMEVRLYVPQSLGFLAEAQAKAGQPGQSLATLAEALTVVEQTDERLWEADLYRVQAEVLHMQARDAEAEASFQRAIEVARRQEARSWELRATTGLARLWHQQGQTAEAHALLAEIYGWFTEGFDTPDLLEAGALLEALAER
jgi:predicted ATPase